MTTTTSPNTTHKFWHPEEEQRLKDLLDAGTPLEECALLLARSSDAVVQKIKRLGLEIPQSWRAKRQTTKSAFQALSWVQGLLSDVKNIADIDKVQAQIDQALEQIKGAQLRTSKQNLGSPSTRRC